MSTSDHSLFALSSMTIACALAFGTFTAQAADTQQSTKPIHELSKVTVEDVVENNGISALSVYDLEMRPNRTGTVTDALRSESFIQFDRGSRNGSFGAEMTPPQISIRGAHHYENNFTVNGLSNNSLLNPGGWKGNSGQNEIPTGDAQGILLDPDLLDNVKVYTENVSAEFGDFTGGLIDARIRDARSDRWHVKTWVNHTRDSWARQHWTDAQKASPDFEYPTNQSGMQREFKRTNAGVTMDGPLVDGKLNALFSYEKSRSSTPVYVTRSPEGREKSTRDMDSFIARLNTDPSNDFYVAGTLIYSPYDYVSYAANVDNNRYEQHGGGWNFSLNTRANLSFGTWSNDFGFNTTELSRDVAANQYTWLDHPENYLPGGQNATHSEGGQGDYDMDQDQYTFKSVLALNPLYLAETSHNIRLGAEVVHTAASSKTGGFSVFNTPVPIDPDVSGERADGVISGEQAATVRNVQPGFSRDTDFTTVSAFVEDSMKIDRFTIRPGVRVSYDDITENVNIAPRFLANADLLNDGRFNVNVGFNRYYGGQVLTYALNAAGKYAQYARDPNTSLDWGTPSGGSLTLNHLGDVDTPYADEIVLGASANIADTLYKVVAVKRDHKDQLRLKNVDGHYEMGNHGKAKYEGITFALEKKFDFGSFGRHSSEFGVTWSDTKTNTVAWANAWADYNQWGNRFGVHDVNPDYVYYDGKLTNFEDLPANNFNAEWVITYAHNASFMDNRLRANLFVRWESETDRISKSRRKVNDEWFWDLQSHGEESTFNADLSLAYDLIKQSNSTLTVTVETLNLFDNKNLCDNDIAVDDSKARYSMGRQFFLGLSYEY